MKNVVIIGSGLSGLSCAYYLKKNGINTAIYDQSNQIGGRIFSENIEPPGSLNFIKLFLRFFK